MKSRKFLCKCFFLFLSIFVSILIAAQQKEKKQSVDTTAIEKITGIKGKSNNGEYKKRGFLVSRLDYRESHITLRSIYKRFFPFSIFNL